MININIDEKANTSILINSLNKIYNNSKIDGKLESINLYVLNIIFKLLTGCCITLTNTQKMQLMDLYRKIYFNSKNICPSSLINKYLIEYKTKFVQAETEDCNQYESNNYIFYWVESVLQIPEFEYITNLAQSMGYINTKDSKTYTEFNTGVALSYLNSTTRSICFNLQGVLETDVYKLYTETDTEVTNLYQTTYITNTNSRLFVAFGYPINHTTIKIKKIDNVEPEGIFNNTFNNTFT